MSPGIHCASSHSLQEWSCLKNESKSHHFHDQTVKGLNHIHNKYSTLHFGPVPSYLSNIVALLLACHHRPLSCPNLPGIFLPWSRKTMPFSSSVCLRDIWWFFLQLRILPQCLLREAFPDYLTWNRSHLQSFFILLFCFIFPHRIHSPESLLSISLLTILLNKISYTK